MFLDSLPCSDSEHHVSMQPLPPYREPREQAADMEVSPIYKNLLIKISLQNQSKNRISKLNFLPSEQEGMSQAALAIKNCALPKRDSSGWLLTHGI